MAAQILATIIFVAMFALIITEKIPRHIVSLTCGVLTMVLVFGICMNSADAVKDTLNVHTIFTSGFWYNSGSDVESSSGINWATIIFIAGMMIMVEGMALSGFFRFLCMFIAKLVNYKPIPIFITFMILSAVLSMFIDSITVILFLAAVTIELSRMLKFDPVPFVLAEIFCANLGGSATMCGDPPNIIIGTALGYSFSDFLTNTGLVAGIALIVSIAYFYLINVKKLKSTHESLKQEELNFNPWSAITNKLEFITSTVIFLVAVVLLITHASTGLSVATIGTFIAILTLVTSFKHIGEILKRIDYKTLLFFIGLFVVVGGLEQTGALELVANFIGKISGGNTIWMIIIVLWISAISSAFVDNIPFAATMIPIIKSLAVIQGVPLPTLAWTLALATDIGGSATPIGGSANVVGVAVANKEGNYIGWGKYCKTLTPITVIDLSICTGYIILRYL